LRHCIVREQVSRVFGCLYESFLLLAVLASPRVRLVHLAPSQLQLGRALVTRALLGRSLLGLATLPALCAVLARRILARVNQAVRSAVTDFSA